MNMNKDSILTILNTIAPAIEKIDGGCPWCIQDFCEDICEIFPDIEYDGIKWNSKLGRPAFKNIHEIMNISDIDEVGQIVFRLKGAIKPTTKEFTSAEVIEAIATHHRRKYLDDDEIITE